MRPHAGARALAAIVRDLIETHDGATYFAKRVWGVARCYDLGGTHPLIWRSIPDFELLDGSTANEHLRAGSGLLLDFEANTSLRALAERWADRIVYVALNAKVRLGLGAVLARPDGVVAWACDGEPDLDDVTQAATRWFGKPKNPT